MYLIVTNFRENLISRNCERQIPRDLIYTIVKQDFEISQVLETALQLQFYITIFFNDIEQILLVISETYNIY